MPGKLRSKILKWLLAVCVVLGLVVWWYSRPAGRVEPTMVLIPAGDFQMGDQSKLHVGGSDELPVHTVSVSAFLIGNCEVTKAEWDVVRDWGKHHGFTDLPEGGGKAPDHPVHSVSWYDVVAWCNARSLKEDFKPCYTFAGCIYKGGEYDWFESDWSANGYRLPTEAEWEKAARGGLVGKEYPSGDAISHRFANFIETSRSPSNLAALWNSMMDKIFQEECRRTFRASCYHPAYESGDMPYTVPVASFPANRYGLHDIAGNVFEWCWGSYGYGAYPSGLQTDPRGTARGSNPVVRGGGWDHDAASCRVAFRMNSDRTSCNHNLGFRVVRSSVPPASSR